MSNYDEIIKNAFDKIEPPSDDESFIRSIIERADNMEKEKGIIKTEQKRLVEITVPKVEKKPSRAPWIAGAAGLTAAALAVGFIAGGRLSSGKEIKTTPANGAGYSGTAAVTAGTDDYSEADITSAEMTLPDADDIAFENLSYHVDAGDVYEFDNCSVKITGYDFDGIVLNLFYDVTYKNDTFDPYGEDDVVFIQPWRSGELNGQGQLLYTDGNKVSFLDRFVFYEPTRTVDFLIGVGNNCLAPEKVTDDYIANYKFTAECSDMSFLFGVTGAESTVSYAQICNFYMTPCGYLLTYPGKGMDGWGDGNEPEKLPEITIVMCDGTEAFISSENIRSHFDINFGFVAGGFLEKTDTRNIKMIIVDDTVIFDNMTDGNAADGVASTAADPSMFEFRDYSVRIKSLTLSGGRLDAEYDVIYPDGVPTSESAEAEPRVLICPVENIRTAERAADGMEIVRSMASDSHTMHYHVSFKYDSYTGDARIVFYDTKHFPYSNDIPYNMTYSTPITVVGQSGYYGDVTTAVEPAVSSAYAAVTAPPDMLNLSWLGQKYQTGDYEVTPVSCMYDGNILRIDIETTDTVVKNGLQHGVLMLAANGGILQTERKTAPDVLTLYGYAPEEQFGSSDITVKYMYMPDFAPDPANNRPTDVFSFTLNIKDPAASAVRTDRVGVDMGANGFGPEGLIYDGLNVSDQGVVFNFSSDSNIESDIDNFTGFEFTAKDRDGYVYDLAKDGLVYQDAGSGRFIYQVLVIPDDLGGKKLTDMKLISVNGLETLLNEMSRAEQPELTTVSWINDEPLSEVSDKFAETDTTAVPVA